MGHRVLILRPWPSAVDRSDPTPDPSLSSDAVSERQSTIDHRQALRRPLESRRRASTEQPSGPPAHASTFRGTLLYAHRSTYVQVLRTDVLLLAMRSCALPPSSDESIHGDAVTDENFLGSRNRRLHPWSSLTRDFIVDMDGTRVSASGRRVSEGGQIRFCVRPSVHLWPDAGSRWTCVCKRRPLGHCARELGCFVSCP
ncbi:hypothetical protein FKP32DRAFT_372500 [Trametes sanguinea]|nr:hypothetical protein FKP32DRAFT_372500 [Trametes sanguinea]